MTIRPVALELLRLLGLSSNKQSLTLLLRSSLKLYGRLVGMSDCLILLISSLPRNNTDLLKILLGRIRLLVCSCFALLAASGGLPRGFDALLEVGLCPTTHLHHCQLSLLSLNSGGSVGLVKRQDNAVLVFNSRLQLQALRISLAKC